MINGKRFCTINTDASWSPDTRCAGFAYWIVVDGWNGQVFRHKGFSGGEAKDPNDAEIWAIVRAIEFCLEGDMLSGIDVLVVNTDSYAAIEAFKRPPKCKARIRLHELIKRVPCSIYPKHVKGHSNGNTPRSYVNNWCDAHARKGRIQYEQSKRNSHRSCHKGPATLPEVRRSEEREADPRRGELKGLSDDEADGVPW